MIYDITFCADGKDNCPVFDDCKRNEEAIPPDRLKYVSRANYNAIRDNICEYYIPIKITPMAEREFLELLSQTFRYIK